MAKRQFEGEHETQPNPTSDASRFNNMLLKKLQKALIKDPEQNLIDLFPSNYASRLAEKKKPKENCKDDLRKSSSSLPIETYHELSANNNYHIIFPLSPSVLKLLETFEHSSQCLTDSQDHFKQKLDVFIQTSDIIWASETCAKHRVVRHADVVIKIIPNLQEYTEYTSMLYLEEQHPEIPAPRPKGLLMIEGTAYIFMSYIPGITLSRVWESLAEEQKIFIRDQLDQMFLKLKDIRHPENTPLGGVHGEGCKDTRRHTRYSKTPIFDKTGFDDFLFSNPHFGGSVYIRILHQLAARQPSQVCFCHGDLRPDNIVVQIDDDGKYQVTGLLDWEKSGFYPEYFECVKATSTMSTSETNDWFLFLPKSVSPTMYTEQWLMDRLWDKHVA